MTSEHFKGEDLETRVRQLEEAMTVLKGDGRLANLPYGTLKDAASSVALRTVEASANRGFYHAGTTNLAPTLGSGPRTANRLEAIPMYLPSVPNLAIRIGIYVGSQAAGNFRLGIYGNKGEKGLRPHKLLLDAGTVSTSTQGVKLLTIRRELPRGLIWLALVGSSASPSITEITAGYWMLLGASDPGGTPYNHVYAPFSYAALPDPFPTATFGFGDIPCVSLKFG